MSLASTVRSFLGEERGNSAANVVFLMLLIAFGGLAADVGNLYRMRTMMQATADSAVLAAAQEVMLDPDNADDMAMYFVETNMPAASYGGLTTAAEVRVGQWDSNLETINVGATPANAVGVILERSRSRNNSLPNIMFWITGNGAFDLSAGAVAVFNGRECEYADGMIAMGQVNFNSVNRFGDNFCVYGRQGIIVNNVNDFTGLPLNGDGTGALVGMGDAAYENFGCDGIYHQGGGNDPCDWGDANPGMREGLFHSDQVEASRALGSFSTDMAFYQSVFDSGGDGVPESEYYSQCEWSLSECLPDGTVRNGGSSSIVNPLLLASMLLIQDEYRTFYLGCDDEEDTLQLDAGDYRNMSIITNCMVHINSSSNSNTSTHSTWRNVSIITVADGKFPNVTHPPGKNANFQITGGNQFGTGCGLENSVHFVTTQSIEFAGNNRFRGVEITAAYDLIMAGNQSSYVGDIGSFSAHVLGNIYFTSTSDFVHCPLGPEKVVVRAAAALVY